MGLGGRETCVSSESPAVVAWTFPLNTLASCGWLLEPRAQGEEPQGACYRAQLPRVARAQSLPGRGGKGKQPPEDIPLLTPGLCEWVRNSRRSQAA